mgnify:CR=1 FL=1
MSFIKIETKEDLQLLDQELITKSILGLDTEFRRTSKENINLSLIQVNDSIETYLIDCISIGEYKNYCRFLFCNEVIKIFHSSREDVEAIYSWTEKKVINIFDTQLANAFLGGSSPIAYKNLVNEKFGFLIDKNETRSNWIKRPLRDSQLDYAASDVEFLIELYVEQNKELEEAKKIGWLFEETTHISNLIFLNERNDSLVNNIRLSKSEEEKGLSKFNQLVVTTSKKWEINPTILFSKKNQRDFLKMMCKGSIDSSLATLPTWKSKLLEKNIRDIFKYLLKE